jgi:hypothetical protein
MGNQDEQLYIIQGNFKQWKLWVHSKLLQFIYYSKLQIKKEKIKR